MSASSSTTLNSAVENDPKASKTTDKSAPEELDKLPGSLDDDDVDIHTKLRQLRKDEIPALTQSGHNVRSILADDSYFRMIWTETGRYIRESRRLFIFQTFEVIPTSRFRVYELDSLLHDCLVWWN